MATPRPAPHVLRQRRRRHRASSVAAAALLGVLVLLVLGAQGAQQQQPQQQQPQQHSGALLLRCYLSSLLSWARGRGAFGCARAGGADAANDGQKHHPTPSKRWKVLSRLSARPERALEDALGDEPPRGRLGEEVDTVATVFDAQQAAALMPALARAQHLSTSSQQQQQQQQLRDAAGDGSPGSFNLEQSTRMGRLTSMAYCATDSITAWNCTRCLRVPGFQSYEVVFDQQWDLLAYTGYDQAQDAVVVAFRGTDSHSWGNWINNLKTWRANKMYPVEGHPGAMVHAGFYDLWTNSCLQRNLTRLVGEIVAAHPTPRLFMTGHSMGGALSNLAALDLKFVHNFTEVRVWTFGQPRVGNLAWEQLFQEHVVESWRFTHNRDIVPSLPPRLLGFHHVPREAWLVDFAGPAGVVEEKVLICDGTGEDPSCHNSACMLGLCTSVADHLTYLGLEMYRDALEC